MRRDAAPSIAPAWRRRPKALGVACAVLLVLGTIRLLALALHDPVLGYANQYDMARTSACADLWPALPAPERYVAQQSAPVPYYIDHHFDGGACYRSSGAAFVVAAKMLVKAVQQTGLVPADRFPLRAIGAVQALALIVAVLAFCRAERLRPWARLGHAAVFALVLADPANALWLNTLYTESATLLFAYVCLGLVALAPIVRPVRSTFALVAIALAGLALSRQQYVAFAALPLLILAPYWWRGARAAWVATALALVAVASLQAQWLQVFPTIRAANNHDFYLGAVLPAVHDEPRALAALGLPGACRDAIGSTWYVGMGADPQVQCTDVARLARHEFLRVAAVDPALPWRVLLRGLPEAQAWWLHYLGMIEGESFGDLPVRSTWLGASLASAVERLPLGAWLTAVGALAAAWIVSALAWTRALRRATPDDGWIRVTLACASLGLYALASSIFGDGYVEVARHALLVHSALAALVLLCVGRLCAQARDPRALASSAKAMLLALALAAAFGAALDRGAREWPMGRGVVDEPATRAVSGDIYALRGWALDPFGVATVRIGLYDDWDANKPRMEWQTPAKLPKVGPNGEALRRYFPTYPGSDGGGFAFDVPRSALQTGARCLRTRVENRYGIQTEIDRRCLQP